jgi:NAD(P)-dependent dehydrogenase (short-subunit alcohol dehydrogenase family)
MNQPANHTDEASPRSTFQDGAGLEGKVAIVTGGGAAGDGIGNGRAAAILLARDGRGKIELIRLAGRPLALQYEPLGPGRPGTGRARHGV